MLKKIVWVFLLCTGFQEVILAQNMEKMEKKAQKAFYQEDFKQSIVEYNKILVVNPKHRLAIYRLHICSLLTEYRNKPIQDVLQYRKTQGRKDKFYNYWLARVYFNKSNFKKAIERWNLFLTVDKYKSSEIINETKEYIRLAELADAQYSHPENYEIEQLSDIINTSFSEYSPVYFKQQDELLFLSSKKSEVLNEEFQIYHSFRKDDVWNEPTPIEALGKFSASNANIEVVNNGGKLYLYKAHGHKGDLYYSEKANDNWMTMLKVDASLSSSKLESHFFINEKEDRILFAHRKTHKPFDLDIYESKKNSSEKWSKPALLSHDLSSNVDEDFPYMTPDGKTLYFSSKGFESLGGYDVYKSTYDESTGLWSSPESLKYPTNSTDDDIQFKIDEVTNSGYFVSNRIDTNGSFDIFFFHESAKVLLSGNVIDSLGKPADHAQIQFFSSRETGLVVMAMTDENGNYSVRVGNDDNVKVDIYFHDEMVHSENFETPHSEGEVISMQKDFSLAREKKAAEPEISEHVEVEFTTMEDIGSKFRQSNKAKLSNIYFAFASSELTEDNHSKLETLLEALRDYPTLKIEIAGHTDNVGKSEINLRLSHQRAEAVVNYMIGQGVASVRLVPKGYGDAKPLASNDDEKDGRELNRRIEVVVIE